MYKINRNRLTELFACIAAEMPLYMPQRGVDNIGTDFALYKPNTEADFDTLKTALSIKGFYLPYIENLYKSVCTKDKITITPATPADEPFVLFGVRACDVAAVKILDEIYLNDPIDPLYKARRDVSVVVSLACEKPNTTCFCQSVGINPNQPDGDISVWIIDDVLYWQSETEKGNDLTEKVAHLLEKIAPPEFIKNSEISKKSESHEPPELFLPNPAETQTIFNLPIWDELHKTCIACGTCTFVCPTCQCYNIGDYESENAVHCTRHWDACLFPSFTQMAHGNPRPDKKERFRQRYMHKLLYHAQKYNKSACVGCGRCVAKCPVNMNILYVARALKEAHHV